MNSKFEKKSIISVKEFIENKLKNNHMLAAQVMSSDPRPDTCVILDKHFFA